MRRKYVVRWNKKLDAPNTKESIPIWRAAPPDDDDDDVYLNKLNEIV
jgi:hypothetical protein